MAGLADTVAELMARARAIPTGDAGGDLDWITAFGPNPGALRMGLHIPARLMGDGGAAGAPLVVVLHGCGQSAAGYATGAGWVELAERHGFVLLCPEQARTNNPNLCFNWFEAGDTRRDAGEAASIAQMVRYALAEYRLDARRVFVTGLSAGGAMTAVMLADYPELFAAGAVVAGLPYGAASGVNQALGAMRRIPDLPARAWGDKVRAAAPPPPRWPRISIWHGEADTTVTPAAGEALARQWCDVHGLSSSTRERTEVAHHAHQVWRGPDGQAAVEIHRVAGLGHGAPIASGGEDGCGSPAPWILEAGLCSSLQIARFWGIAGARRATPRQTAGRSSGRATAGTAKPSSAKAASVGPWPAKPAVASQVGETIARALRGAGLLR